MAKTTVRGGQILDGDVARADLNTTTTGQAVTTKIIAGANVSLGSTGVDPGTGDVTINATGSNKGTATLDFGAFPGSSNTSVVVTGQGSIIAGSVILANLRPVATVDHTADEHLVETITVQAGNIVAGTGFTIYGANNNQINDPVKGTRIWGQWSIAWIWS